MYSLLQSRRIRGSAGEVLDVKFPSLDANEIKFVRGQLVLVAAGPGTGKSVFALNLALAAESPCLYFSADSDSFTQVTRSIAITKQMTVEDAKARVLEEGRLPKEIEDGISKLQIRFDYLASPSLDDIELRMDSYQEVYGEYPELVIIDNITNVRSDNSDDDPFSGLETLLDYLHTMARDTEACIVCLHHVTGPFNDGDKPIPLSGIKGQVGRVPEMVLTMYRNSAFNGADYLCVCAVKNRGGRADPTGHNVTQLVFDGPKVTITDQMKEVH